MDPALWYLIPFLEHTNAVEIVKLLALDACE